MPDKRTASRTATEITEAVDPDDAHQAVRQLGARAHQLRAATRAADHFNRLDTDEDRDTASWLMSSAVVFAAELAADVDALARSLRDRPADAALRQTVVTMRTRAHQLHAAARAADHFLDLESAEDLDTGGWLVVAAAGLARRLACEIDDGTLPARRPAGDVAEIEPHDPALARRVAHAVAPARGAA